ncbi:ABC transporter permease subunit [Microbacterium sediminicola]
MLPVTLRGLRDGWRGTLAWAVGLVAALSLYLPLYPSFGTNGSLQDIMASLPPELIDTLGYDQIGTGAGYAQATFFGLIGFALVVIATTAWGAAVIGGAEESGRLELDLAHGIGRVSYTLQSALAIGIRLLFLGLVVGLTIGALNAPSELELDAAHIAAATVALCGLGALCASAGLLAGALTGRRVAGVAAGAGVAVYGYAVQAVANQSEELTWVERLSPYAWAYSGAPLENGLTWGIAAVWGVSLALLAAAALALRSRDVTG